MTRFADPTRCPDCGAPVPPGPERCTRCHLPLTGPDAQDLFRTLQHADAVLERLRGARVPARAPALAQPYRQPEVGPYPMPAPRPVQAPRRHRSGLSQASVPKILLGLGALCLLVAAVVFLALAWSVLGVGGRTVVLVGLTAAAAGCCALVARRALRAAAESLAAVAAGLLVLDLVGADHAGWFPALGAGGLTVLIGAVLAGAGVVVGELARRSRTLPRLGAAEIAAALGVLLVTTGVLLAVADHVEVVLVAGVVGTGAVAALARRRALLLTAALTAAGTGLWWLALLTLGLVRAGQHPSYAELWGELHAWPLLAAAVLAAAPVTAGRRVHRDLRVACALVGALVLTLTVGFPLPWLEPDLRTGLALGALLAAAGATYVVAGPWWIVPAGVVGLTALIPVLTLLQLAGIAVARLLPAQVWSEPAGVRLADPTADGASPLFLAPLTLAAVVSLVALSRLAGEARPSLHRPAIPVLALLSLALAGTAASYAVPLALALALAVVAALLLGLWSTTIPSRGWALGSLLGLFAALGVLVGALVAALVSAWLTAAVLLVLTVGAGALRVARGTEHRLLGEVCLPPAAAALLWTIGELAEVGVPERGAAALVLLGALAIARPGVLTEVLSALSGAVAAAVGVLAADDPSWWLTVDLTVAGTLVLVMSLVHAERRVLAPVGGLLLTLASWVRLADEGVGTPEAYTLPAALALLAVGVVQVLRHPAAGTRRTLAPGLVLALSPSLLWAWGDPVSWRALALGVACLVLVLAGTALRWSAPVSLGAGVGGLLVLRELAPYAEAVPQWVLIGLAGAVLTFVGVTWESRLRQLRATGAYLERLR